MIHAVPVGQTGEAAFILNADFILNLPNELLQEIFRLLAGDRPQVNARGCVTYPGYYSFTQVCRRLRGASLACLQVWAEGLTDVPIPEAMETAATRAKTHPLRVKIAEWYKGDQCCVSEGCRNIRAWLRTRRDILEKVEELWLDGYGRECTWAVL